MRKVLVIGCGGISGRWIEALISGTGAELMGLLDLDLRRAEGRKKEFQLTVPVFTDIEEAVRTLDVDTAAVLTPPDMHLPVSRICLEKGLDVLCEKPLAGTMKDAREMLRLSETCKKRILVMQNRRYLSGIRKLRALIDHGAVGDVTMVHAEMLLGAHFGKEDFRYHMAHPLLLDMLVHTIDEARYILHDREIRSAYCQEFHPKDSWYEGDAGAVLIFETMDGAVISIRGSWVSHAENTSSNGRWHIAGTKGAVLWDGKEQLFVSGIQPVPGDAGYFEEEGIREAQDIPEIGRTEHRGCIDAMLQALTDGSSLDTECFRNIHTLELVFACLKRSAEGRKVLIRELQAPDRRC